MTTPAPARLLQWRRVGLPGEDSGSRCPGPVAHSQAHSSARRPPASCQLCSRHTGAHTTGGQRGLRPSLGPRWKSEIQQSCTRARHRSRPRPRRPWLPAGVDPARQRGWLCWLGLCCPRGSPGWTPGTLPWLLGERAGGWAMPPQNTGWAWAALTTAEAAVGAHVMGGLGCPARGWVMERQADPTARCRLPSECTDGAPRSRGSQCVSWARRLSQ